MITKEQGIQILKEYLKKRKREYTQINEDRSYFEEQREISCGRYEDQKRDVFCISYEEEGYQYPELFFVAIDVLTGKVLYTLYGHGYLENREEEGFE